MNMGRDSHYETAFTNRIILFAPYFGLLPEHFPLWLKSCEYNPSIDWVLFVDHPPKNSLPPNVRIIELEFQEFIRIISTKLEMQVALYDSYKLCDIKPAYGYIFEEMLEGYTYWGHCDIDLIFGDIRKFITNEILNTYEKILFCGHLTLYRNTPSINQLFMYPNELINYQKIFTDPECCFFDEHGGMDVIAKLACVKQYSNIIYADISHKYKMLTLTELRNHEHQVFYWDKGEVIREYLDDRYKSQRQDSFAYIHFQKRKMIMQEDALHSTSFYITPDGFEVKNTPVLSIADFKRYNYRRLMLFDWYIYNMNRAKNKLKRIKKSFNYKRQKKMELVE